MDKLKKINIVTLGCSKNLVDSEYLMKQLETAGWTVVFDSNDLSAKVVIVNTCGFIADAKEESVFTIVSLIEAKSKGDINKIFVMGCLSQRYKEDLKKELPEVDGFFGVNEMPEILTALNTSVSKEFLNRRLLTTPKHYAYLKISEGCDRTCSFCAIPLIKGKHTSRPIDDLVKEAHFLVSQGVKEIILIAQDLSYYGMDIYKKFALAELLYKLSAVKGLKWLRLHYTFPAKFPMDVIEVMKTKSNICKYLDIPVQHISNKLLKNMRRGITKEQTYELIDHFRKEIPGMALRTTLLVGHPGETDEDFRELIDFVRYAKFERLGVFTYSEEENTYSAKHFKDDIPFSIKQTRMNEIMDVQREISNSLNTNKIGKLFKVIIDRKEGDYYVGRTEFDSPEVDNEVIIKSGKKKLKTGNFYTVEITGAEDFDLIGELN